ncbi:MAG: hypothetical protein AB1589_25555 [Cyanobacteriota bacterium]
MPKKRCGFGFDCAGMMMQPGVEASDCLNYEVCGAAQEYTDEDVIELVRVREERRERIRISRGEAARMMLMQRGCSQTPESFGVTQLISEIESTLNEIKEKFRQFEGHYIAPSGAEVHQYTVKRRGRLYQYEKLSSQEAIFEPVERSQKVKVVHLGHSNDPRCLKVQEGIERRNRLTQSRSQLREIRKRLAELQIFLDAD